MPQGHAIVRRCGPVVVLAALLTLPQQGQAQSLPVCGVTGTSKVIVLDARNDGPSSSGLVKQLGAGGGLAVGAGKTRALSNTIDYEDALRILRSVEPRFANPETAETLMSVMRSTTFKTATLGVLAYGTYLVIEGVFGGDKASPEQTRQRLDHDLSFALSNRNLGQTVPCASNSPALRSYLSPAPGMSHDWLSRSLPLQSATPRTQTTLTPAASPLLHVWKVHPGGDVEPDLTFHCGAACEALMKGHGN